MIAFSINAERGYVIISVKDSPTLEEYVESCRALGKHDRFNPSIHRICDFTKVGDLSVSNKEVMAFVEEAKNLPISDTAKIALIGKTEEDRAVMELFSSQFDNDRFKVFENGRDAMAWVLWSDMAARAKGTDTVRVHRLSGTIEADNVLDLQRVWFNEQNFDGSAPVLWDLRQARFGASISHIEDVAEQVHHVAMKNRPDGRTAMLVGSKLYEATLKTAFHRGIENGRTRIFLNEDEAYDWLLETEQE